MKKLMLFVVLFVVSMPYVLSLASGENYLVTSIDKCYNMVDVKVRGTTEITEGDYNIQGCYKIDDIWKCECKNNSTNITFKTRVDVENTYDITTQHYISKKQNDNSMRVQNFNNLAFVIPQKEEEVKEKEELFSANNLIAGAVFILIFLLVMLFIIIVGKWCIKSEPSEFKKDKINYKTEIKDLDDFVEKIK